MLVELAAAGSLYLLVRAYGLVQNILISRPLAALTTLVTLSQGAGTIRFWRRNRDPLHGISARQYLDILKEEGIDPAALRRGASAEIKIEPTPAKGCMRNQKQS